MLQIYEINFIQCPTLNIKLTSVGVFDRQLKNNLKVPKQFVSVNGNSGFSRCPDCY